jgi:hypothetical protein
MHAEWSSHTSLTLSRNSCPASACAMLLAAACCPPLCVPLPEATDTAVEGGKAGTILLRASDSR